MTLLLESLFALFITIDPIGVIGPYLSLTSEYDDDEKNKILFSAIKFATTVLIVCLFIGGFILDMFGISTFSLKIAGGILFFKFGYDILNGRKYSKDEEQGNPALVPLGFPIIAGPGSITAVILLSSQLSAQIEMSLVLITSIMVIMFLTFISLKHSVKIIKFLGDEATKAIIKITGLLIITIGVQLILSGISDWLLLNSLTNVE